MLTKRSQLTNPQSTDLMLHPWTSVLQSEACRARLAEPRVTRPGWSGADPAVLSDVALG